MFGSVTLVEDTASGTKYEGLYPWKLESESFDFTGLYSSVEVTIPKSYPSPSTATRWATST